MPISLKIKKRTNIATTIIVSLVCILLTIPTQSGNFNYDYAVGDPWRYDQLIAKYEFLILKSPEQQQAERDSVLRNFAPFFNLQSATAGQQVQNLRADYAKGALEGVPAHYMSHAIKLLQEVYAQGVVSADDYGRMADGHFSQVRIISGTAATTQSFAEVYSARTAYQYLMTADSANYSREIMARLNLNNYLEPNLLYDSAKTVESEQELLSTLARASGKVRPGQRIIDRGEIISPRTYSILNSMKADLDQNHKDSRADMWRIVGKAGLVVMFFSVLLVYLHLFRKDLFDDLRIIHLLFALITIFCVIAALAENYRFVNVYVIPFAMVAIFVRVFMDTRTAFMAHFVMLLIASLSLAEAYRFILIESVAGIVAIYSLRDLTERSQLFKTAAYVSAATMLTGFCLELLQTPSADIVATFDRSWYIHTIFCGISLLFAYPLLYLIERVFDFTSSVTLVELSSINNPLLRQMSKEAQGTFQHSMQVSNLAAEIADHIGARVQLVRTGALYHDIGKVLNPTFFTENQSGMNPHDSLTEERSAQIIINHVSDGMRLAEKSHLPRVIREFISTHHGRSLVKYFYVQACNRLGEDKVDKAAFTYPGKNPYTREQAILMMADSVEAASRSLKEYTEESIASLVNRIVDAQVAAGYFTECPITFRDISDARRVLIESLKTIYHTRIAYPELRTAADANTPRADQTAPQHPRGSRLFGTNTWTWNRK